MASAAPYLDIERNLAAIGRQWPALLALCEDEAVFMASAPSVSGWNVARQVHHTGLELDLIAREIAHMLAHPDQGSGLAPTHPFAMRVLEQGHFPRGSGQAPMDVVPPDTPARNETRRMIQAARAKWAAVTANPDRLAGNTATHPHPILGPFSCALWLRFIPIHTAHHLKITRDILESSSLSAPYGAEVENVD